MKVSSEDRLAQARALGVKKYGRDYVNLGDGNYKLNSVRTPSLMLDYKLGTGGFPYGHGVEVYGANRIGKSSAIGYGVLGNVTREVGTNGEYKIPALIAVEPRMVTPEDREWGLKLGFDPDKAVIYYPDNVEEAFDMLRDLVFGNLVDYIMIDSLGGMGTKAGAKEEGKKRAYGISGEVTAGLNDIMPRLFKNNIGLLIINQQRQASTPPGMSPGTRLYESPGGEALHHHMRMRIHVKPGKNKYQSTIGGEKVKVGQELTCVMRKNNLAEGQEKTAKFDFFHIETEEYGFGIDTAKDVIDVGMLSGVIRKGGGWYYNDSFPKGKLNGKDQVRDFLKADAAALEPIREGVMDMMLKKELEAKATKQDGQEG